MTSEENHFAFHLEEYTSVRNEIELLRKNTDDLLLYSSIANAAIASWIASFLFDGHPQDGLLFSGVSWLPSLVLILTFLVYLRRRYSANSLVRYIEKLENEYARENLGWFSNNKTESKYFRTHHIFYFAYGLQLIIYITFGVYVTSLVSGGSL